MLSRRTKKRLLSAATTVGISLACFGALAVTIPACWILERFLPRETIL